MNYAVESERYDNGSKKWYHIYRENCLSGYRFHAHIHSYYEIIYCKKGAMTVVCNESEKVCLHAGDVIMIYPTVIHSTFVPEIDDDCTENIVVKFSPMFFHPENPTPSEIRYIFAAKTDHDSYALVQKDHREYDMIISVIEDTYREFDEKNVGYELMLRANTSRLYTVFMRLSDTSEQTQISYGNSNMAEAAAKALSYIEKNYDRQIGMMEVSEACHISYSYFSRNFSKWTGVKFNDYLLKFRINKARKLLLCSSESITSISISCGFENISYFIKKFRQVTGYTPKDFRNQYKNS